MKVRLPQQYQTSADLGSAISDVLRANGLDPGVTVTYGPAGIFIETNEASIPAGVKMQIKNAVLPLLLDINTIPDLTL